MDTLSDEQAYALLKKYAPDERIHDLLLKHVEKVREIALRIGKKVKGVDIDFISTASLLHDIGRFSFPPGKSSIKHGIEGAKILRGEGYPEHARVCETHIGVGISKEDIERQGLPLPKQDYLPKTKEEIIISYADNLVAYDVEKDIEYVKDRFRRELGADYVKRVEEQHQRIIEMMQSQTKFL